MLLLPSGKTQLKERDVLGVVGQAGFAQNKEQCEGFIHKRILPIHVARIKVFHV